MSAGSSNTKKQGLAGGLKGIILVAALGVAFLIQKFTGIDILSKLKGDADSGNQTVAESQDKGKQDSGSNSGEFKIPDRPKGDSNKIMDREKAPVVQPEAPKADPKPAPEKTKKTDPKKVDDGVAFVRQQYKAQRSKVWVTTMGEVVHILPDDNYEPRHQQFLLGLAPDLTVKVAHNIDDAPYVTGLKKGDHIKIQGRYEWNDKGGVIHFTHKADRPTKTKPGGWIEYKGKRYQ